MIPHRRLLLSTPPLLAETRAWASAVRTAGGSISDARVRLVDRLIRGLVASGSWAKTDDYAGFCAENLVQALVTLKGRRIVSAVNFLPGDFTVDRGFTADGLTKYFDTGWIEASHALTITGASRRIGQYRRSNPSGTIDSGATDGTNSLAIRPRSGSTVRGSLNSGYTNSAVGFGLGLLTVQREADDTMSSWGNGVLIASGIALSATVVSGQITGRSLFFNALNNNGTPANHSSETIALGLWGARLTTAEQAGEYGAIQNFMTAIGANV